MCKWKSIIDVLKNKRIKVQIITTEIQYSFMCNKMIPDVSIKENNVQFFFCFFFVFFFFFFLFANVI